MWKYRLCRDEDLAQVSPAPLCIPHLSLTGMEEITLQVSYMRMATIL